MSPLSELRSRRSAPVRRRVPRGMVLLVVLVVLALLLLAGAGAMRSVDTGNVISGNFAFQQAAMQAADRVLTDARNAGPGLVSGGGGNTTVSNRYYSTRQTPVDSRGFPTAISWDAVACVDPAGVAVPNCAVDDGSFRIQYVVERMCSSDPDLTDIADIRARCEYEPSLGAASPFSIALRYRVIMRVRGPRGTEQWFEAMLSGPASS